MSKGILIAGTHSGSGKTTVTLGVLAALKKRGLAVQPFKCGPDFIDPTLHRMVTGAVSRNLDPWMCGPDFVRYSFDRHGRAADLCLVEGVMGLFDGGASSSASLARALALPVVLVVDARSAAESIAAVVKGFEELDPGLTVAGVIFNRVGSKRHLDLLQDAVRKHCRAEPLGYLPREVEFTIPERHLGLYLGDEQPLHDQAVERLAATVLECIDLDRLLALAAEGLPAEASGRSEAGAASDWCKQGAAGAAHPVRIGIARDRAFCFYYEDNLDLLRAAGAELVEFSPLRDSELPAGLAGIYLGGGYPELYAETLAANTAMRRAVRTWSEDGRPLYAECGGFMYLAGGIVDLAGQEHPMCGCYPVLARMRKRRVRLGYCEAELAEQSMFGAAGAKLRGHEFHYSDIGEMPASVARLYRLGDGRGEGYRINNTLGGYLHLHFGSAPDAAQSFVRFCQEH